ncbi:MAG: (d)CMP kinase [Bacilli bacterium]|nr:(d)CMP kinase [Bacilli bacterium]
MIIAIDGPAGSGKGTISKILAERLGYVYIDTGSMYRSLTYLVLRDNIDIDNEKAIYEAFSNCKMEITKDCRNLLDGEDISDRIRTQEINTNISKISGYPSIRELMRLKQREFANDHSIVMEGRDITTEVFPDADYKFYLDASIEERTKRRVKQNEEKGLESDYNEIYESIKNRDLADMTREYGALKRTDDQIYIDSSNMTIEEVVLYMLEVIK